MKVIEVSIREIKIHKSQALFIYADKKYAQLRIWVVTDTCTEGVKTTRSNRLKFMLGIEWF